MNLLKYNQMYVMLQDEYDEEEGYPEGGIAPGTKWRTFQKILNAHYVMLEKISFQKLNKIDYLNTDR